MLRSTLTASSHLAALALAASAAAQPLQVDFEKVLYKDMEVAAVGPFVSQPRANSGVLWSQVVTHATRVPAVRVHVQVRQARPSADWGIRIRDLAGNVVETVAGGSPYVAAGAFWSREVSGRGAEVELYSDTTSQGLGIAVDQYAFRVVSGFEMAIVGVDQRVAIGRAPQPIRGWAGPIARLSFIRGGRQYLCTGFMVTPDLLMTNEHCLSDSTIALSALADFGYDSPSADPDLTLRVTRLEAVSRPLDYAVVRLEQRPGNRFGQVTFAGTGAAESQSLVVIQHPAGEHKQASFDDCQVRGASKTGVGATPSDFGHICDTLGGSSGSPVFDRQSGTVVGLHHLGFHPGSPDPANQAVHIRLVLDDLRSRASAVHAEISGGDQ